MSRLVVLVPLLVAACAGGQWVREGATDEQLSADLSTCRSLAQVQTDRDRQIDADIRAARSTTFPDRVNLRDQVRSAGVEQRFGEVLETCMRRRGYHRKGSRE